MRHVIEIRGVCETHPQNHLFYGAMKGRMIAEAGEKLIGLLEDIGPALVNIEWRGEFGGSTNGAETTLVITVQTEDKNGANSFRL